MQKHGLCVSRKGDTEGGGTDGGGWGHPHGDVHMVAVRLGLERAIVGTRWATTSQPDCMDRLKKHYSHLCRGLVSNKEGCVGSERVYNN